MCRIPFKKKKTRNDEDLATWWRSPLPQISDQREVEQRAAWRNRHTFVLLLHHLTFSNPTRGLVKGLSRASYQGSV